MGDGSAVGVRVGEAVSDGRGVRVIADVLVDSGVAVAIGVQAETSSLSHLNLRIEVFEFYTSIVCSKLP